jgi:hypothetical protein
MIPMKNNQPSVEELLSATILLNQQKVQLSKLVWDLTRQLGGRATVDEHSISPLWQIHFEPTKDTPPRLVIEAQTAEKKTEQAN